MCVCVFSLATLAHLCLSIALPTSQNPSHLLAHRIRVISFTNCPLLCRSPHGATSCPRVSQPPKAILPADPPYLGSRARHTHISVPSYYNCRDTLMLPPNLFTYGGIHLRSLRVSPWDRKQKVTAPPCPIRQVLEVFPHQALPPHGYSLCPASCSVWTSSPQPVFNNAFTHPRALVVL